MLGKVFLLIMKYVLWFPFMNFFNHWLEQTFLFGLKTREPNFFWFESFFWIFISKLSWVFHGKIDVSLENNSWLPDLPRQLKTHIAFSTFPILDTNLWLRLFWYTVPKKRRKSDALFFQLLKKNYLLKPISFRPFHENAPSLKFFNLVRLGFFLILENRLEPIN